MPRNLSRRASLLIALAATSPWALAQTARPAATAAPLAWPTKPLKIIVGFPAGTSPDLTARTFAEPLSKALGQPIVVDNRPGANGNIGAAMVAQAGTENHTLLLCDVGALAITPSVYTKLTFNPDKDLKAVAMLAYSPHLLVVHPSVPANNLKELVDLSHKQSLNFAVTAIGSAPHLAGVAVQQATKAGWQYVPYKGGAQAIADTVGGTAQVLMNGMLATYPHVQSGKLKLLAVSKRTRMALVGQTPTIAESGVPNFESGTWQGVMAPAGMPDALVQRINTELVKIIRTPEIRANLAGQGAEVVTMSPAETNKWFQAEEKRWAQVVKAAGVKLDA